MSTKKTVKKPVAVQVKNVTKDFYLPHHNSGSIKEAVTQIFKPKAKGGNTYHALKNISFEVRKGEFFGIVGRNGAGKSTLLKILAEIYQPTAGSVHVHGKLVPFIELGVGFNNNLTGRQNVYLSGAMLGFSKREIDARYDSIVEFAELKPFMDQKLKNYSSGMRVRLAFSVAIQAEGDILLLDEVLAVGDANFKKKCYSYFDSLKEKKKTIIFVSHGMGAVREYCDRAILIEGGEITAEGAADEVADRYMQLFEDKSKTKHAERKKDDPAEAQSDRWGTREVYVDSFDWSATKNQIKLDVKLKAGDEAVKSVKFGATVKDKKGRVVAGFSTMNVQNATRLSFKANETKHLKFELDNILGNREYIIAATLTNKEGTVMYDKWNNVMTFSNNRENVHYPTVVPGKLTVK